MGRSLVSSSRWASRIRSRRSHWYGVVPVLARNRRAKVRGLMADAPGQVADGHGLVQVLLQPGDGVGEQVGAVEVGQGRVDVLGLAALAVRRDDQIPGDLGGDLGAVVALHHMQAQVDAGRAARRGEDVAVVGVQHPGVDRDLRVAPGQLGALDQCVVAGARRGAPPRPARTRRCTARAGGSPGAGPRAARRARPQDPAGQVGGWDDHGPRGGQRVEPVRDLHREPGIGTDRRLGAADRELIQRHPGYPASPPKMSQATPSSMSATPA